MLPDISQPKQNPSITIIYASTSGNTEAVCDFIGSKLTEAKIANGIYKVDTVDTSVFDKTDLFIFATSTWEHGVINPQFNSFLKEMESKSLARKSGYFIGLGDVRYEPYYFCEGIEILKRAFEKAGGKILGQTLKINGDPFAVMESAVDQWANELVNSLRNHEQA